ncbi:hypothetical protein [Nocardia sp. NPDC004123]
MAVPFGVTEVQDQVLLPRCAGRRGAGQRQHIAEHIGAGIAHVDIRARAVRRRLRSPRALVWARAHAGLDGSIGSAALSLLTDIGEKSDAPRLFDHLEAAHGGGNDYIYDQCSLVDALTRLDHVPAVPVAEAIFDSTVHSYLRIRCAEALSRLSTEFRAAGPSNVSRIVKNRFARSRLGTSISRCARCGNGWV